MVKAKKKKEINFFGNLSKQSFILIAFFIFICVLIFLNAKISNYNIGLNIAKPAPTIDIPYPSVLPTITPTPSPIPVYVDPDPIISCTSSYPNCVGQAGIQVRRSQCSNIICCQVGNTWSIYATRENCTAAQNATRPQQVQVPQNTQKTLGNNYYCWNNAYGYFYYTSSGDQCNADNLKSTSNSICLTTQKMKVDSCDSACKTQADSDRSACYYAYVILNSDPDKYGECLNGPGGETEAYGNCLKQCTNQYGEDIKQCN